MPPLVLHLDFRGYATPLAPGVVLMRANAGGDCEAFLESRLSLVGGTAFDLVGTVSFGDSSALRFRTVGLGVTAEDGEPRRRTGAAICEIERATGELEDATGRITSNFLISETGEVSDHHVVVLFPAKELVQ